MKKIKLDFDNIKNWSKKHIFLFTILIVFSINLFITRVLSVNMVFGIQCIVIINIAIIIYIDIERIKNKEKKKENNE